MRFKNILILVILVGFTACKYNSKQDINPVVALYSKTTIAANITYRKINNIKLHLNVYVPSIRLGEPPWVKYTENKKPVLLYFHGGGWRGGTKESRALEFLPYVDKGWVVVTADYRVLNQTSLPNIIGDCRSALNWVYANSERFKIDTNKVVISGNSAGGHLALMTALVKNDALYKSDSYFIKKHKVAAVINWYGISDVSKFVKKWKDKQILYKDTTKLNWVYKITSPLNFVDKNTPPILTVHGTKDEIVSFAQAEMLRKKLDKIGIKNKLIKISNKKHGNFNTEEMTESYQQIWKFLDEIGIKSN